MEKLLNKYLNELDLEKLRYETLSCYNKIFEDSELVIQLESELSNKSKLKDISLIYKNTNIIINDNDKDVYVNFNLYLKGIKIGYLKGWYDINGTYIDDFLVFD